MQNVTVQEVEKLYEACGIKNASIGQIRQEINRGTLNNRLNSDFSYVYGRDVSNNFSNITVKK